MAFAAALFAAALAFAAALFSGFAAALFAAALAFAAALFAAALAFAAALFSEFDFNTGLDLKPDNNKLPPCLMDFTPPLNVSKRGLLPSIYPFCFPITPDAFVTK